MTARASAAEIAAEIARTRDRLSRDLARLDREYALRHLVVRATRLARNGEFDAAKLRDALSRDALPLAVTGIGLGWLGLAGTGAGRDLLQRLGSALAALQQLGRELGIGAPPPEEPVPVELPPTDAGP
jgi:hypothetical protein